MLRDITSEFDILYFGTQKIQQRYIDTRKISGAVARK